MGAVFATWSLAWLALLAGEPARVIRVGPTGDPGYREPSDETIRRALRDLGPAGGRVLLTAGSYRVAQAVYLANETRPLELVGEPGADLLLDLAATAPLATAAAAGASSVRVASTAGFAVGRTVEFHRAGQTEVYERRLTAVGADGTLTLGKPLDQPLDIGTPVLQTTNVIQCWDRVENLTIRGLTIDLQRDRQPLVPRNHTTHCGILVSGRYSYAGGATSYARNITIADCQIRNAHHRGLALYAAEDCLITGCTVANTGGEAIDLDHFCRRIVVANNRLAGGQMTGIELNDAADCVVRHNQVTGYAHGVRIWHYEPCVMPDHNTGNRIAHNVIRSSRVAGVHLAIATTRNEVVANLIDGVTAGPGILVQGHNNRLADNTIRNAQTGDAPLFLN